MISLRRLVVAVLTLSVAGAAHAQAAADLVRGTVRDSASRQPIVSAIVLLLDSADAPLARGLTNERGEYRLERVAGARRLRALRIGFRPRDARLPSEAGATSVDLAMVALPTLLTAVHVEDAPNCPRRADRAVALALWEQARTGLLATVVGAQAVPGRFKWLTFERTLAGTSDTVVRQHVEIDSGLTTGSFQAVSDAAGFVERGFMQENGSEVFTFFGPDANVMLDPAFAVAYCFRLRDADATRPREVGLGFTPARRRAGRVDIDGTLWVDTAARSVHEIEFRYLGLDQSVTALLRPGGRISFRAMPNGVVMVDRWTLHLPAAVADAQVDERGAVRGRAARFFGRDVGGEIARAEWPDGSRWEAALGTLRATIIDGRGKPVTRAALRLSDTDYLASPDGDGIVELTDLLPGPYTATVIDVALARLGMAATVPTRIVAVRDSIVEHVLIARQVDDFVGAACLDPRVRTAISALVVSPAGAPATDARWELGEAFGTSAESVAVGGRVDANGRFQLCPAGSAERELQLRVWRESAPEQIEIHTLVPREKKVTFTLPRP